MKRFILGLAVAALALSLAGTAEARWVTVQLNWQRSNTTDGLYYKSFVTTGAAAKVDTTEAFNVDDADMPPPTSGWTATTLDTVVIAKVIVYGDSSTASAISFASSAFALQGNAGSKDTGWQAIRTYSSLNTDLQKYVEIPIYLSNNAVSKQLYIDRTGDFSLFGINLRLIATLTGATAVPTMKAKLVYWSRN